MYSSDCQSHPQHLEAVLKKKLAALKLYAKISKCSFGQEKIEYLGHVVSKLEVEMDRTKISAIMDWAPPTTVKLLRGFLGLTGYYRRFIQNYSR